MKKGSMKRLVKYEFINTMANFFTPFFGIVFPTIMGIFLTKAIASSVPDGQKALVVTAVVMMMGLIIPFSIMLVSFPALFAQEIEKGVIKRFELFNFRERELITAKIIVHYSIVTLSGIFYAVVMLLVNDILLPKWSSFLIYLVCFYLLGTLLFIFAYAISMLLKKFGPTYAVTMTVYFALMGLSGMMGAQPDQLPDWGKKVAYSLPMAHISTDFRHYWVKGFSGYNFAPLIQTFIFMAAIVALVYLFSWYQRRRPIN